jgi:hypothetical protein
MSSYLRKWGLARERKDKVLPHVETAIARQILEFLRNWASASGGPV